MWKKIAVAFAAALLMLGPTGVLLGIAVLMNPAAQAQCLPDSALTVSQSPGSLTATTVDGTMVTLNSTQLARAATIITVGGQVSGVGKQGVTVALMAALTESSLRMLANSSAYPESASYPNDGDGGDHDSLGMFQMRPQSGWGTVAQLMDPTYQAKAFFGGPAGPNYPSPRGLLDIPGWQSMSPGVAAQSVEVSAYPDRYANYQPVATAILTALTGAGDSSDAAGSVGCLVSGDPQQLAQVLVAGHAEGTFRDSVPAMFTQEIEATANGTVTAKCQVDSRVLQVLVLTMQHFGSVGISDLGRTCVGSTLDCPSSPHCTVPDLAADFISVGGQGLNGSNSADIALLKYLDTILPDGSWAGQSECRAASGDPIQLEHIGQFADTCTHQHIDIRGIGSVPLTL
jgi:hypothetical protein